MNIWKFQCYFHTSSLVPIGLHFPTNNIIFTFATYLTLPQMTFDLIYVTFWSNDHMEVPMLHPRNHVWSQLDVTFSHEHISQLDLRWPMTLFYDLWSPDHMKHFMLHLWPKCDWNPANFYTRYRQKFNLKIVPNKYKKIKAINRSLLQK